MTPGFGPAERRNAETLIELALAEDLGDSGDLTALATIPESAQGEARFVSRRHGVVAGLPVVALLAARMSLSDGFSPISVDGGPCVPGTTLATVRGSMRRILAFERTALNFLQRLSGIASRTALYVAEVSGTAAKILDTRKTTPGWRFLEKYAVRCGGGTNHRFGLYDAILIKDNHLAWLSTDPMHRPDPIASAIQAARATAPHGTTIEIEVDTLEQFDSALRNRPDIILVDNFDPILLSEAIRRRDAAPPGVILEVSGGVNLSTVRALALTGVERISVGDLTHSAPALDIGLDYD